MWGSSNLDTSNGDNVGATMNVGHVFLEDIALLID